MLNKKGVDLNQQDERNEKEKYIYGGAETCLHKVCYKRHSCKIARYLIEEAKVNFELKNER